MIENDAAGLSCRQILFAAGQLRLGCGDGVTPICRKLATHPPLEVYASRGRWEAVKPCLPCSTAFGADFSPSAQQTLGNLERCRGPVEPAARAGGFRLT